MHPTPHRRTPSLIGLAAFAALANACRTAPPPQPAPPPPLPTLVRKATRTPTQTAPVAATTPTPGLEEGAVGEAPPPSETGPSADGATPIATATAIQSVGTSLQPESLASRITAGTPPNVAAALRLIEDGRQQMDHGAYDRALEHFERAVAIDPTNAYGYYFLAQLHFLKKDYDQAIAFSSRAVALGARTDLISLGRIHSLQGAIFEQVGRYPDARSAYQKAIEADPNNLSARVGAARLSGGRE